MGLYARNSLFLRQSLGVIQTVRWKSKKGNIHEKQFQQKSIRVAILGGETRTGQALGLLLKQNPLVSGLFLQGFNQIDGFTEDLKSMDTRSKVDGHFKRRGYQEAVRAADIVVMLSMHQKKKVGSPEEIFKKEANRVVEMAEACSLYAPKAIVVVNVHPISLSLPLVRYTYKKSHWYHPARIIGGLGVLPTRANAMVARHQDLDAMCVHVPLVGGPDVDSVVPLFTHASPANVSPYDAESLIKDFRYLPYDCKLSKVSSPYVVEVTPLAEAHSLHNMICMIGLGLCGDISAIGCAFVRCNIIPGIKHLVSCVRFGPTGVVHNFGIPKLSTIECKLLEKSALALSRRDEFARLFLKQFDQIRNLERKSPEWKERCVKN